MCIRDRYRPNAAKVKERSATMENFYQRATKTSSEFHLAQGAHHRLISMGPFTVGNDVKFKFPHMSSVACVCVC